jgi:hypothetical protein
LIAGHEELTGEGRDGEGEERRGARGHDWLCWRWGCHGGVAALGRAVDLQFCLCKLLHEEGGKRDERREKKMKEKKKNEKHKKMWKFFQI